MVLGRGNHPLLASGGWHRRPGVVGAVRVQAGIVHHRPRAARKGATAAVVSPSVWARKGHGGSGRRRCGYVFREQLATGLQVFLLPNRELVSKHFSTWNYDKIIC